MSTLSSVGPGFIMQSIYGFLCGLSNSSAILVTLKNFDIDVDIDITDTNVGYGTGSVKYVKRHVVIGRVSYIRVSLCYFSFR